jgi:general secretion pathway protein D
MTRIYLLIPLLAVALAACAPQPPKPSPGHLSTESSLPRQSGAVPPPVQNLPYVPPPAPAKETELYTVVVDQVPVRELLFALARDASLNVDIHPGVQGVVTLNAIDQTLAQILERISLQAKLSYEFKDGYLSIGPDEPLVRHYPVAYVNMSRQSTSEVTVATQVAATGSGAVAGGASGATGGGNTTGTNNSTTKISSISNNEFWNNLVQSLNALIREAAPATVTGGAPGADVVAHPESGMLTVRATARQHREIQKFLDQVLQNVQRQVLIEATIVEVRLGDRYQAGVDWQRISGDYTYIQSVTGANLGTPPAYVFRYTNPISRLGDISATLRLLEEYGNVKVLSSPKIMALNNQSAILKVVDNRVYFTVGVQVTDTGTTAGVSRTTYQTVVHTVPEGLIINVTPQISESGSVTLNIRPTISRIIGYVNDPNPELARADVVSRIPEVQVREIESILKVNSGDVAIIGGLMQDISEQATSGVPVLSKLPGVGDLFSYRDDQYRKTELVLFLRPLVIQDASLGGDLQDYRAYLPDPTQPDRAPPTGLSLEPESLY